VKYLIKIAVFFLFTHNFLFAQQDNVKYERGFEFVAGIYPKFENFKNNESIRWKNVFSSCDKTDRDCLERILTNKKILYLDSNRIRRELLPKNVWGYTNGRSIYISSRKLPDFTPRSFGETLDNRNNFVAFNMIGSVSFTSSLRTVRSIVYTNPFDPNNYYPPEIKGQVSENFMLDFETGKILGFSLYSLTPILKKDSALYYQFEEEYSNHEKSKEESDNWYYEKPIDRTKKDSRYYVLKYIKLYNERNPIYFPKTKD